MWVLCGACPVLYRLSSGVVVLKSFSPIFHVDFRFSSFHFPLSFVFCLLFTDDLCASTNTLGFLSPPHTDTHIAMIKATSRNTVSRSIFSSTFLVAFSLVLANSLVPCPVDHQVANESANLHQHAQQQQQQQKLLEQQAVAAAVNREMP